MRRLNFCAKESPGEARWLAERYSKIHEISFDRKSKNDTLHNHTMLSTQNLFWQFEFESVVASASSQRAVSLYIYCPMSAELSTLWSLHISPSSSAAHHTLSRHVGHRSGMYRDKFNESPRLTEIIDILQHCLRARSCQWGQRWNIKNKATSDAIKNLQSYWAKSQINHFSLLF